MKKLFVLIFVAFTILFLQSCTAEDSPSNVETGNLNVETTESADQPEEIRSIEVYPMGTEKIDAPREKVVQYMLDMANIEWTAKKTAKYTQTENWNIDLKYEEGTTYRGMLYSFTIASLEGFKSVIDSSGVYTGETVWNKAIGNDCTTSVMAAWQIISPTTLFQDTKDMFSHSGKGVIPVGDYKWDAFVTDSTEITQITSKDEMFENYALLKPGDLLLCRWSTAGHCRLIDSEPVLVRHKGTNKILGSQSYVTVIEHCSSWNTDVSYPTTWRVSKIYSLDALYNSAYIPITCVELASGKADAPYFRINNRATSSSLSEKGRLSGTIISNYRMLSVNVNVTSESGEVCYDGYIYPADREASISSLNSKANLFELAPGKYTLKINTEIGPGTFEIDKIDFEKK